MLASLAKGYGGGRAKVWITAGSGPLLTPRAALRTSFLPDPFPRGGKGGADCSLDRPGISTDSTALSSVLGGARGAIYDSQNKCIYFTAKEASTNKDALYQLDTTSMQLARPSLALRRSS